MLRFCEDNSKNSVLCKTVSAVGHTFISRVFENYTGFLFCFLIFDNNSVCSVLCLSSSHHFADILPGKIANVLKYLPRHCYYLIKIVLL